MADEIEGAFERFLAFLPEETRGLLDGAEHILGMTQLAVENAKRCSVEASGPDWDCGINNDCRDETWAVCGVGLKIEPPRWHPRGLWAATFWRGSKPKIEAFTFPELFDKIVAAAQTVLDAVEEPDTDTDTDTASEWTPNFWHCGPPLFTGVPECGGL